MVCDQPHGTSVPGMQSILLRSQRMYTLTGLDASTTFANLLNAMSTSFSTAFTNISDSVSTVFTQARVEHQEREYWFWPSRSMDVYSTSRRLWHSWATG